MLLDDDPTSKTQPKRQRLFPRSLSVSLLKTEILAGMTVALALIPESLAFAAIANVNPMVALYTSFCMAVVTAIAGGRPAMISAATGSMAILMVSLVENHGVEYLFAATILTGLIQFCVGLLKLGRFFSFIPHSVISGFVNALAILIFAAQLKLFAGEPWQMYVMVAATLAIVVYLPKLTKAVPSPLVAIVVMTAIAIATGVDVRRVGDIGEITRSLPSLHIPMVDFSLETLSIILPYSIPLAIVGILESLLTAAIVDDTTDTNSSKNKEIRGQGIANLVTGCLGGMAGCGMVGQSIINVRSGAKTRLSTFVAGAFLLFSIFVLRDIVQQIPMAALIGVMFVVAYETFDWSSLKTLRIMPLEEALVMPFTVVIVLWTHDLAKGVLAGVALSAVMFGWRVAQIRAATSIDSEGVKLYSLAGQLFFGSAAHFVDLFDFKRDPNHIVIDFTQSHVWDHAGANAIAKVINKYHRLQKRVTLVGLNPESYAFASRSGITDHVVDASSQMY